MSLPAPPLVAEMPSPAGGPSAGPTASALAPWRERLAWGLYDFANTVWSMNIATLFFAVWLVSDLHTSNTAVAVANGVTSLLVLLVMPLVGAVSDARGRRMPWIRAFTLLCVLATLALGAVGGRLTPGAPVPGATLALVLGIFVLANGAYQISGAPYNAMLPTLAPPAQQGRLSGLGTALGYVGSIVGVLLVTPFMTGAVPVLGPVPGALLHTLRHLVPFTGTPGRAATFAPTALLFLLVALPLLLFGRDRHPVPRPPAVSLRTAFAGFGAALRTLPRHRGLGRFLVASLLYQDAMGTIVSSMALYAVEAMGFRQGTETTLFVLLTVPAVLGSAVLGRLTDRVGPKRVLTGVLWAWVLLLAGMILAPTQTAFLAVGVGVGLIFGGLGTAERPMLLQLVPEAEAGRYFGLMVLSSRAAAVIGPFLWAAAVDGLTPSLGKAVAYRAAVATVGATMLVALWLLRGVPGNTTARVAGDGGSVPRG